VCETPRGVRETDPCATREALHLSTDPANAEAQTPPRSAARPAPVTDGEAPGAEPPYQTGGLRQVGGHWLYGLPAAALIVGLAVTAVFALVSQSQYVRNEHRLIRLRVGDAAALVTEALPDTATPLATAAELLDVTNGNVQSFKKFISAYVGSGGSGRFASISLWRLGASRPLLSEGIAPKLALTPTRRAAFFSLAAADHMLSITGLLSQPDPRLGYALAAGTAARPYVLYAENPLPANRRSRLQRSSQFAGLLYALYLGHGQHPQNLLVTNVGHPPLTGATAADTVPFGNSSLTLVMASPTPLAGSLPEHLPLIILIVGTLLSLAAAAGTLLLIRRRLDAEQLASELEIIATENRRLYAEQRTIAQTLQHALLPDRLPRIPGVQASACYEAGEHGVDIGGDWYDVLELTDRRLLLVVGDVSGRGLRAATTMAALRYAIHAYAAEDDPPAEILTKLTRLVRVSETGQLATILCTTVDVERGEISVTSAGHLPPLLISNGDSHYVTSEVGLPIGVEVGGSYISTTVSAPPDATLVAYTDGLVEQRGEDLDAGLARLREAATGHHIELPELLSKLVTELRIGRSEDDVAIVGVRWTS
jgi:serine phosphatase RsbU (regulator of sigma subunit)